MELRKLWFPILLALLWIAMMAMAMVDFAKFNATTAPAPAAVAPPAPLHSSAQRGQVSFPD